MYVPLFLFHEKHIVFAFFHGFLCNCIYIKCFFDVVRNKLPAINTY